MHRTILVIEVQSTLTHKKKFTYTGESWALSVSCYRRVGTDDKDIGYVRQISTLDEECFE